MPNIVIYPHQSFSMFDGGMVALYQLANLLQNAGINVRMDRCCGAWDNPIFNQYLNPYSEPEFIKNAVVVYCEGTVGNPLNARKVVRWMLSAPGRNVPLYANNWGENDLVYYFNPEPHWQKDVFKLLTIFNLPENYKDLKLTRNGTCYAIRKSRHHAYQRDFPPSKTSSIKIENGWLKTDDQIHHNLKDPNRYTEIFNRFKFFVSYDPMTFTSIIAALCGCVSIVNPCETMDKEQWLKKTCYWPYLELKGLKDINGIAYGMADVQKAIDTIHLAHDQIHDMAKVCNSEMIKSFIEDINKFVDDKALKNTVKNNFFPAKNRAVLLDVAKKNRIHMLYTVSSNKGDKNMALPTLIGNWTFNASYLWVFTEGKFVENNNTGAVENTGTWEIIDDMVVLKYDNQLIGYTVMSFDDENTLVGENKHQDGQMWNITLKRKTT